MHRYRPTHILAPRGVAAPGPFPCAAPFPAYAERKLDPHNSIRTSELTQDSFSASRFRRGRGEHRRGRLVLFINPVVQAYRPAGPTHVDRQVAPIEADSKVGDRPDDHAGDAASAVKRP